MINDERIKEKMEYEYSLNGFHLIILTTVPNLLIYFPLIHFYS